MERIKIIHIVRDDKFFDAVAFCFDSNPIYDNTYLLVTNTEHYTFKYINKTEKVEVLWNKKLVRDRICRDDYDVIFFQSILPTYYKFFKYIKPTKIVIWWAWGFDLYSPLYGTKPFISIELYKPLTKKYHNSWTVKFVDFCKRLLRWNLIKQRKEWIKRIDYFNPVIQLEYELMKNVPNFRAKEYHYPFPITVNQNNNYGDHILIGHSATYENNHLDVWNSVCSYIPEGRKVIFPLSYGNHKYALFLRNKIKSNVHDILFLMDFLPQDEYYELTSRCSYAIFGVVRQMAMGNIYNCLQSGVKVFLFRDSLVYKHLCSMNYVVFAIEDIDDKSFIDPLSEKDILHNKRAFYVEQTRKLQLEKQFEQDFLTD